MNCKTVRTYGLAMLDEELSPRKAERITSHLDHCPVCRHALTRMASLYNTADPAASEVSPHLWSRINAGIDRWEAHRSSWTLLGSWMPRAAAACATALLVLAGIAAGIYLGSGKPATRTADLEYTAVTGLDRFDDLQPESLGMAYLVLTVPEQQGNFR